LRHIECQISLGLIKLNHAAGQFEPEG
jgi:hypothetical protein